MIAVIADDLTGAAEIAGLAWRHGLTAEILVGDEAPTSADLVVFDTDSRDCSPVEARRRVARVARRIGALQPAWIFKKVDSVLRGNVLEEIAVTQKTLGLGRCLLVPANPAAGRVIKRGHYFIKGTPIDQTDFRLDPGHPRTSARVVELLGPRGTSVVLRNPTAGRLPGGVVVGEAAKAGDVWHWATRVDGQTLPAGGADFFAALLGQRRHRPQAARIKAQKIAPGKTLFVSGSLAESSIEFLSDCCSREWPVLMMPYELFEGGGHDRSRRAVWARRVIAALARQDHVAIGIGQPTLPGKRTRQRLGGLLTETVKQVLSETQPERVCVEGGSTAALLIQQMGWKRLVVAREFATGVTAVKPSVCPTMELVFKPGSYAWPDCLCS